MSVGAIGSSSPITIAPPPQGGSAPAVPVGASDELSAVVGELLSSIASGIGQSVDVMA